MSVVACRRFQVSGKVQGVFFRASAMARARGLGLSGWARNLDNGDVEVVARGALDGLRELADWLTVGPPAAQVSNVSTEVVDLPTPAGFEIR